MIRTQQILLLLALMISLIPQMSAAGKFKRVETEEKYRTIAIGKTAYGGSAKIVIHSNGKISGSSSTGKYTGKWWWADGFFCRSLKIGGKVFPNDCQTVEVDGNKLKMKGRKGKGQANIYTLK